MSVVSRKVFPACAKMCICWPALCSRSRRPVKRYKKLLAEIFRKSSKGSTNERKVAKLCAYAAKNPFRMPKIAKYLEERCYKELRSKHIKTIIVIMEVFNKFLSTCKDQMACFAMNLLNACIALLDDSKRDTVHIIGCQTLTRFIYSQVDGTYAHDLQKLVKKVSILACKTKEEDEKICIRAESLQCLAAMVWFMMQFSQIFVDFDEIVHVTLSNYEPDTLDEAHDGWVNEVVRCQVRDAVGENSHSYMTVRPRKEKKDPALLTREETQMPKVWAQICIQRMVDLGMESAPIRRVLDPMFLYFDTNQQWGTLNQLGFVVLSDMAYFVERPGNQQLILASLVHHLDHKNVSHDPEVKSYIIQTIKALARQVRSEVALTDIGYICDLCRHLRKSLEAAIGLVEEQELRMNTLLQFAIEDCLLEIVRGIPNAQSLFEKMAMMLEKLPPGGIVARTITGSMIILAHVIVVASVPSNSQQVFPEGLLVHLMKLMVHPDVELRSGGHLMFSVLLIGNPNHLRHDDSNHKWKFQTESGFTSVASLLDKVQKENDESKDEKCEFRTLERLMRKSNMDAEGKQVWKINRSMNLQKLSSMMDKTAGVNTFFDAEPSSVMKFTQDQSTQLLSAFWVQANLPDNTLLNLEALAYSFCLTLTTLRLNKLDENLMVHMFQLPLSLSRTSLDYNHGKLCPAHQRSLFTLSTAMLMFAAKTYKIPVVADILEPILESDVDTYLGISDDLQVFVKPQADVKQYGSGHDNQVATCLLPELRRKMHESYEPIIDIVVRELSSITQVEEEDLGAQLWEIFMPDDAIFGPQSILRLDQVHRAARSKEPLSLYTDLPINSLVEDDTISESYSSGHFHFVSGTPAPNSTCHVMSIRQLLESALGQVAGSSISDSPLPFGAIAGRCEAQGADSRSKISACFSPSNACDTNFKKGENVGHCGVGTMALKLPPLLITS